MSTMDRSPEYLIHSRPKSDTIHKLRVLASCALFGALLVGATIGHGGGEFDIRIVGALAGALAGAGAWAFRKATI